MMNGIKYFTDKEMACSHCGMEMMSREFMRRLDFVRTAFGKPLIVTSGYRCPEWDKEIGGKGNHPTGEAADLLVAKGADMYDFTLACFALDIPRIIVYRDKPHVHVDMNPARPRGVFVL